MIGKLQATAAPSLPNLGGVLGGIRIKKGVAAVTAGLLAAAIAGGSFVATRSHAAPDYTTTPVLRQDLTQSVTASGIVSPQNTVNVGTQVSGTISAVYVDFNSKVKKGQVLARLDTSQLDAQLAQAQASLAQAQAQADAQVQNAQGSQSSIAGSQAAIASASAGVDKAQSALALAQQTVTRDRTLLAQGYIAQSQLDADVSAQTAAQSALSQAQATLTQSRAQTDTSTAQAGAAGDTAQAAQAAVAVAQAQVQQDQLNVDRTVITSPVDGTVIARDVSVGETVAASLQTPTLFAIAQNLNKMEVDINVGEPDIGNVRAGDSVSFSVLAYPNQTFKGTVAQVRINPTTVNNVVTYDVVTLVSNTGGKLLPGMTANASIGVQTVKNALVVPAQALAFRPATGSATHHKRATSSASNTSSTTSASSASPWGQTASSAGGATSTNSSGLIFIDENGKPKPVRVKVGLVSGTLAAVTPLSGPLNAGDSVIVSSSSASTSTRTSSASRTSSPLSGGGTGGLGRGLR